MGELRCWNHLRAGTGQLRRNALEDYASRRHPREREFAIPGRIFQCLQSPAVQQSSEQPGERELRTDYEQLGEPTSDPTRAKVHLLASASTPPRRGGECAPLIRFQPHRQDVVKNDLSSASVSSGTSSAMKWPLPRALPFASTAFCFQKSMALRKAGGRFPRSAHKDRTGHAIFLFQSASSISRSMLALAR